MPLSIRNLPCRSRRTAACVGAALFVGACVPSGHLASAQAPAPLFDPVAFFAGHTEGRGQLAVILAGHTPTLVEGRGVVASDGSIELHQIVRRGTKPTTQRVWHLYRVSSSRYSGTLSDASGPVTGDVSGNLLHLSFAMRGGLHADQYLYLRSGGQVAQNRMVVSKLGIPVASLDETITRLPS